MICCYEGVMGRFFFVLYSVFVFLKFKKIKDLFVYFLYLYFLIVLSISF